MQLFGRKIITCPYKDLNDNTITQYVSTAYAEHATNQSEIDYLYQVYKGKQDILSRQKETQKEICNKIVENRANEIVSFKTGYVYGEPVQYVARNTDENTAVAISLLNDMMLYLNKPALDKEMAEWRNISGVGYRLILPKTSFDSDRDFVPFNVFIPDPRYTFVVYSTDIGNPPLFAVMVASDPELGIVFSVYSKDHFWRISGNVIIESRDIYLGEIPIIEYPLNMARLGSFETVLPLLDAINNLDSNRMDGIEQDVQAFLKFINCDIDEDEYQNFLRLRAIKVSSTNGQQADVDSVTTDLDQSQSQTFKSDLYDAVLTITGLPNRNGGSSTSDTGSAVLLRDGWSDAEARAKDDELMFKKSETQALKLMLNIIHESLGLDDSLYKLKLFDIGMQFTRRNYDNIQSKSQVLISMLNNPKIHPRLAFIHSGLFSDPEDAYQQSMKYYEEEQKKAQEQFEESNAQEKTEEEIVVSEE